MSSIDNISIHISTARANEKSTLSFEFALLEKTSDDDAMLGLQLIFDQLVTMAYQQ